VRPAAAWAALLSALVVLGLAPPALAQQDTPDTPVSGVVPTLIDIPKLGTHASIVPLGLEDDGSMQAPTDPDTVGWYDLGPGVGGPGNALLDGHVDWGGRLRVFGFLKELAPGDQIQLTDADGNVYTYRVQWTQLFEADTAPLDQIFEEGTDQEVTLITCGGDFDPSIHTYLSRWVVRAVRSDQ
jgi:sortase (surface protein transpeptidase)